MAKFDEADPRWIVELRDDDAHNLNQWHWTDRSLLSWCEDKLRELLPEDLEFGSTPLYVFFVKKIEHIKGEVMLLMRKGKAIVSYQLDVKLRWVARATAGGDIVAEGSLHMPYISDENDLDEFDIKISMTTAESSVSSDAKQKALEQARLFLRSLIPKFLTDLLRNHSSKHGAVVGSAASPSSAPAPSSSSTPTRTTAAATDASVGVSLARAGSSSLVCKTLKMDVEFCGPPGELFECFSDSRRVAAYAGSDSQLNFTVGGQFALFDRNVSGKIVDIKPRELLVLSWRLGTWPAEHYSLVTLTFAPATVGCTVSLVQESVPAGEVEATRDGWTRFYWDRISAIFGCKHTIKNL